MPLEFRKNFHDNGKYEIRNADCAASAYAPLAYVQGDKRVTGGDGLAVAEFIVRACNAHDDLVSELQAAEKIIVAMLNAMTIEQKAQVGAKLEAEGVSGEGMTRYHERRAALAKAGA